MVLVVAPAGWVTFTMSLPTFLPSKSMLIAVGSCSKPSTTVSSGVSFPAVIKPGDLADRLRRPAEVVEHDEAFQLSPLNEQVAERTRPGRGSAAL